MEHLLDNPVWNALISGNKHLSYGDEQVKFFDKEVAPFAAFKEFSAEKLDLLYELLPANRPVTTVTPVEIDIPGKWKILRAMKGFQMVHEITGELDEIQADLTPLTDEHVPQMFALARLTKPGPFEMRTIDFGHYAGIFDGDNLVAMAGQRLHPFNYAEVSAVCTHPDYTGKGYARQLLIHQIDCIKAAGEIPFLHVRDDNERAIKVYESLGFTVRRRIYFNFIVKEE
jgi:ribosomal protein S18 acetylase RimI-like enzyme